MLRIADWKDRWEVNASGRPAKKAEKRENLRISPLQYVRTEVNNPRALDEDYRRLRQLAGPQHVMMVYGLFEKLRVIAADNVREKRGQLINTKGQPYTIKDLAWLYEIPANQVEYACSVLQEAGWLESDGEIPAIRPLESQNGQDSASAAKFRDASERNETERNQTELNASRNSQVPDQADGPAGSSPVRSDSVSVSVPVSISLSDSPAQPNPPSSTSHSANKRSDPLLDNHPIERFASATNINIRLILLRQSLDSLIAPRNQSDRTGLDNITYWLVNCCQQGRFEPEQTFVEVLRLASQAARSRNPPRYFNYLVQDRLGYDPKRLGTHIWAKGDKNGPQKRQYGRDGQTRGTTGPDGRGTKECEGNPRRSSGL